MRAWWVHRPGEPLVFGERAIPEPTGTQIRVAVSVCGVCRTDLHLAEGDLPPKQRDVVPGHEVVGRVDAIGPDATRFGIGDRVGIAWLHRTCGACRFCRQGKENLCLAPTFTGWDVDGGYAEYATVGEDYAYAIPPEFDDLHAAPLLCAGIIGYRALRTASCPPGGRLGIYGFGGSAHLAAQIAIHEGARVHVVTRSARAQELALRLGAASAGDASDSPPEPLDAAILFAPSAISCPLRCARSIAAAALPWRAFTSPTSQHSTIRTPSSRSACCAASPPTLGRTATNSSLWQHDLGST